MMITTREISYRVDGQTFTGFYASPAGAASAPAVVIVHEWWGRDGYVKDRAKQLAQVGYTAFAIDMYGNGMTAANPDEASAMMNAVLAQEGAMEQRFDAAIAVLKQQHNVDPERIAAIGYCFGGSVVLNMARAGKNLQAVASFHGLLATKKPMREGVFKGEIAAFTGADDPMVSVEIVEAFEDEMNTAGVTCSLTSYPNVVHGFTNPAATARGKKFGAPLKYNEAADKDSYQNMIEMFEDVFEL